MQLLHRALASSYNVATARLGLELGVNAVIKTLRRLSVEEPLNPYPSLFLGATDLSPLTVTELYLNFASGGFRVPLRSIREVLDASGEPLQRYELSVERVIDPGPAYLVHRALQMVIEAGSIDFEAVLSGINAMGGSLHSIDEVEVSGAARPD